MAKRQRIRRDLEIVTVARKLKSPPEYKLPPKDVIIATVDLLQYDLIYKCQRYS